MHFFIALSWGITLLASCLSALVGFSGIIRASGAPQEAAASAIALTIAMVPYVFTRALEGLKGQN